MLRNESAPDLLELLDTGSPGDIDFYCQYARHRGGPVLVLMCGTGRVAIPIARQGVPVIGIDPDATCIDQAKRKAQQVGAARVMFARADTTNFVSDSKHPLVLIPAGGLQRLLTLEEQRQTLASVRAALALGGRLVLDVPLFNPGAVPPDQPALRRPAGTDRTAVLQRHRRFDPARQLLQEMVSCEWLDANGNVELKQYTQVVERYSTPSEVELLLEVSGFDSAFYGGFDRHPLVPGSARMVVEAERKP